MTTSSAVRVGAALAGMEPTGFGRIVAGGKRPSAMRGLRSSIGARIAARCMTWRLVIRRGLVMVLSGLVRLRAAGSCMRENERWSHDGYRWVRGCEGCRRLLYAWTIESRQQVDSKHSCCIVVSEEKMSNVQIIRQEVKRPIESVTLKKTKVYWEQRSLYWSVDGIVYFAGSPTEVIEFLEAALEMAKQ